MTKSGSDLQIGRRAALTLFASLAAGATARAADDWAEVEPAARKEGRVVLYHNMRPQGAEILLGAFRKAHPGIETEHIRLGSAPLNERFATEFNAQRNLADVMLSFPDDTFFKGVDSGGWALQWSPPEFAAFPPKDNHQNRAFAVNTTRNVIIWNKNRVRAPDAPKEWSDLWSARFKGRVGMDPPWRSVAVQGVAALWNKLGMTDAAEKLRDNDVRFFEGSAGVYQAVLRGDVQIATLADLPLEPGLEDGAPIGFVYPQSGTAYSDGYLFVSARAPHPAAAKLFANWLLSVPGQESLQENDGLPVTRPGVPPPKFIPPTASLSNAVDTLTLIGGSGQDDLIRHWRTVFGIR
ncbi:MAG: extracellular solute-binding protein [Acetobacteraceae bacterium]|nr:extracellular solute-binding protein [Acetobacteraceae bacterium]